MNKTTAIILNDYCHVQGGASKVAIDEAVGLARAGVQVIFLAACGPACAELQQANITVKCLGQTELINAGKNPFIMLQGLWNFKAAKEMSNILSGLDRKNTIVHLHGYTKALTTSPVRIASKKGFKVVCTLHDFFTACPNGAWFDYVKCDICLLVPMSMSCIKTQCDKRHYVHKLYRVLRTFIQNKFGGLPRNVKDYITLSRKSAELLKPYLPRDANYYPLENPIPIPNLPPVNVAANRSVVAVGRLDAEKGIEILLEAAKKAEVSLTLVGEGPLRKLAETYANVQVTGWLKAEQVRGELAKARVLVFPSLWYEAYGLVVAEAAARGVPAIVSDVCAASERIEHGVNGWVFPSGNAEALAKSLQLTHNNIAVEKAGAAAYVSFWANPPIVENHTTSLIRIYNVILGVP